MPKVIKINKGLDINLNGEASQKIVDAAPSESYAVKPPDFHGLTPKLTVKEGQEVKAGTILFYDKNNPEIKFSSPISGTVLEINRGERRRILEVIVKKSGTPEFEEFQVEDLESKSKEDVIQLILDSGLWPTFVQRPYGVIPNPKETPNSVYISCFDSAPMAPDIEFALSSWTNEFQKGIDVLKKISGTSVNIGISTVNTKNSIFNNIKGVEKNYFEGPHPAGNVGTQIAKISPINKGEIVWTIKPSDVITLGRLFLTGKYNPEKIIAVTGSEINTPQYYKIIQGAQIIPLVKDNISKGNNRIISGNVLTGEKLTHKGYLGFYDNQLTVIPEGTEPEFFGWATPGFSKFSLSRTFFSWLTPQKKYAMNTNLHGGHRPFVITGEMEKVLPMDILPMQLLKAIHVNDIDLMEQLGIYEIIEEDFALCEFISTSKIEIQALVRQGLDAVRKEFI